MSNSLRSRKPHTRTVEWHQRPNNNNNTESNPRETLAAVVTTSALSRRQTRGQSVLFCRPFTVTRYRHDNGEDSDGAHDDNDTLSTGSFRGADGSESSGSDDDLHNANASRSHNTNKKKHSTLNLSPRRSRSNNPALTVTPSDSAPQSIVIMLGLGLRHACLNNVSADPPAKDTPHACYISLRPIAIGDYLRRFDKFAQCSDECYAVAAVLLDRWCAATGVQLHRSIVHKLTLTALVVALKMYDDQQYPMDWYAQVGGVETPELINAERVFLGHIKW
eukprot:PhM_4_TR388/c5_g1_i5/m.106722